MHILSKRDRTAVVRYALDRIDEALALALLKEFCAANGILIHTLQDSNNTPWAMEHRFQAAAFLRNKGVTYTIIAKLMHRHYDMIRYYTKPALRERKKANNRLKTAHWRDNAARLSEVHL